MAMQPFPSIEDLLKEENSEMDELFKMVFDSFEKCLDRLRPGAAITILTPTAENNAQGLVTQGEERREISAPWGVDSPDVPLYLIPGHLERLRLMGFH